MTADPGILPTIRRRWVALCPDGWVDLKGDADGWSLYLGGSILIYPLRRLHESPDLHAVLRQVQTTLTTLEQDR